MQLRKIGNSTRMSEFIYMPPVCLPKGIEDLAILSIQMGNKEPLLQRVIGEIFKDENVRTTGLVLGSNMPILY
jgi:hypothetical protein